ncbi:hypothetical protein ACOSP7_005614 [Xanthoceras sorbifolium]
MKVDVKERLEKRLCEEKKRFETQSNADMKEKARVEAQTKADLKLQQRRESGRDAARINQVVTGALRGSRFENPMEEFGLQIKDECYVDDDDAILEKDDKDLQFEMLKSRYSDIILEAPQKTLFK